MNIDVNNLPPELKAMFDQSTDKARGIAMKIAAQYGANPHDAALLLLAMIILLPGTLVTLSKSRDHAVEGMLVAETAMRKILGLAMDHVEEEIKKKAEGIRL